MPLPFTTVMSSASDIDMDDTSSVTTADDQPTDYTVLLDNGLMVLPHPSHSKNY